MVIHQEEKDYQSSPHRALTVKKKFMNPLTNFADPLALISIIVEIIYLIRIYDNVSYWIRAN